MIRTLFVAALAALLLVTPAEAKRVRMFTPLEKLARANAVVVGKVTAIEKEPALVPAEPGAKEKVSYRVAVVKVETPLIGAGEVTHIKVGFEPTGTNIDAPAPPRRGGLSPFRPTVDAEGLFFLVKHPTGDFYTITPMLSPILADTADYKDRVAEAKKAAAALADPMKALKADRAADRTLAANVLVAKYRAYPEGGGEATIAKVPADESALLLKTLAEADWKAEASGLTAYQSFSMLGLNDKDGWKFPMVKPGEDFITKTKEAFVKWLDGPGKTYQIDRFTAKVPGK
ncbi:hypothetical protein R5W24_000845 [Gemmata sp. JC717]|uniref:hypothetical protein n=1 Tax=Gemmata algarum TaxID=2975278 RepID=UPI0021BA554C|nr:hypothetical protein [Gemmata algarum]MDY3551766.1 hypothetical protein [Gemmata algarum]